MNWVAVGLGVVGGDEQDFPHSTATRALVLGARLTCAAATFTCLESFVIKEHEYQALVSLCWDRMCVQWSEQQFLPHHDLTCVTCQLPGNTHSVSRGTACRDFHVSKVFKVSQQDLSTTEEVCSAPFFIWWEQTRRTKSSSFNSRSTHYLTYFQ